MEIMFLFVGVLFAGIGAYLIWDHYRYSMNARKVPGKVTAIEKRTTPEKKNRQSGGPIYYPVIEYSADGKMHTFTSGYGMSLPQYDIGESVTVLHSKKMGEGRVKSNARYLFGGIFLLIGLGLCIAFFNIFNFSVWSIGMAAFVTGGLIVSIRKRLRKHDISTLDELKEAFRNTEMKTSKGQEPEEKVLITRHDEMEKDLFRESKSLKWVAPAMTLIGASVLILGIYLGKQRAEFLNTALQSKGEVISINSKSSDEGYTYYPVVRFTPASVSRPVVFEHDTGSNPPSYEIGEQVTVLYNPDEHDQAIIDAGIMNWFGPGIAVILGLFAISGGIYSWHHWIKLKDAAEKIHNSM